MMEAGHAEQGGQGKPTNGVEHEDEDQPSSTLPTISLSACYRVPGALHE